MFGRMSAQTAQRFALTVSIAVLLLLGGAFGFARNASTNRQPVRNIAASGVADTSPTAPADSVQPKDDAGNDDDVIAAADAGDGETDAASDDPDKEVRKVATDWVRSAYPNSRVEGVFTLSFARGSLYIAGVDATPDSGQPRRTIDLLVRLYTRRNGAQYWRAESISRETAASFLKKANADDSQTDEDDTSDSQHDPTSNNGNS